MPTWVPPLLLLQSQSSDCHPIPIPIPISLYRVDCIGCSILGVNTFCGISKKLPSPTRRGSSYPIHLWKLENEQGVSRLATLSCQIDIPERELRCLCSFPDNSFHHIRFSPPVRSLTLSSFALYPVGHCNLLYSNTYCIATSSIIVIGLFLNFIYLFYYSLQLSLVCTLFHRALHCIQACIY